MIYPKIVDKKERERLLNNNISAETKLYNECSSIEEFYIKRDLMDIKHKFIWKDYFKMYYFLENNKNFMFEHLEECTIAFTVCAGILFMSSFILPSLFNLNICFSLFLGLLAIVSVFIAIIFRLFNKAEIIVNTYGNKYLNGMINNAKISNINL